MRRLLVFIVPMLVALCSRVGMGLSITLSATALGTVALASNQVVESVYWLFCPIGEAISLCMQTYMPSVLAARRRAGAQLRATSRAPGYDHAGECSVNICANNNEMIQYTNLYSDGCNHKATDRTVTNSVAHYRVR